MVASEREAATVAATDRGSVRVEIVGERRRAHDTAFREMVVAEATKAGVRVRDVAHRYGVCRALVYHWRREARRKGMGDMPATFIPVEIAPDPMAQASRSDATGRMEIVLRSGTRVIVAADVDAPALGRVLRALAHR